MEVQGKGNVVPFPERRARRPDMDNPLAVRCRKSGRWLEFPFRAERDAAGVEILWVWVCTCGKDGRVRTVCELELAREDVRPRPTWGRRAKSREGQSHSGRHLNDGRRSFRPVCFCKQCNRCSNSRGCARGDRSQQ